MAGPFKLKSQGSSFKMMGSSPAKHRKDGKWTGHEHETKLGKLTGDIASGIESYHKYPDLNFGYEWRPNNAISVSKDKGFDARFTDKDNRELFSTGKSSKTGKRTTKIFGHELKPLSHKEQQKKSKARKKKFGHFGTTGI